MRKLLSVLAAIGLTSTASTSVIACGDKGGDEVKTPTMTTNVKELTFERGSTESQKIQVTFSNLKDSNKKPAITATSDNMTVADVFNANEGIVTVIAPKDGHAGTATITIKADGIKNPVQVKVTVKDKEGEQKPKLVLESGKDEISFKKGESATVTVKSADPNIPLDKVEASSSNGGIVSVTTEELKVTITGEEVGEATVTIKNDKFEDLVLKVTVQNLENDNGNGNGFDTRKLAMRAEREDVVVFPAGSLEPQRVKILFDALPDGMPKPGIYAQSMFENCVEAHAEGDEVVITPTGYFPGMVHDIVVSCEDFNVQNSTLKIRFMVEAPKDNNNQPGDKEIPHNGALPIKVGDGFTFYMPGQYTNFKAKLTDQKLDDNSGNHDMVIAASEPRVKDKEIAVDLKAIAPGTATLVLTADGYKETRILLKAVPKDKDKPGDGDGPKIAHPIVPVYPALELKEIPHNGALPIKVGDDFTFYIPGQYTNFKVRLVNERPIPLPLVEFKTRVKDKEIAIDVSALRLGTATLILTADGHKDTFISLKMVNKR